MKAQTVDDIIRNLRELRAGETNVVLQVYLDRALSLLTEAKHLRAVA